jgi:hypothetical protein
MSDIEELEIIDEIVKSDDDGDSNNSMNDNNTKTSETSDNFDILNWEQVKKLDYLLNCVVPIHGRGNFPTLNVCLKEFIRKLQNKLLDSQINVNSIHINGGVASYILAEKSKESPYSDIDIIFSCDILNENTNNCDLIKDCVFKCIYDYLPSSPVDKKNTRNNKPANLLMQQ